MADIGMAIPLKPGKTEAWKQFMRDIQGPKWGEMKALAADAGMDRVRGWVVSAPQGDVAVVVQEGPGAHAWRDYVAHSDAPIAEWFRETAESVHGTDFGPDGDPQPPVEFVFDFRIKD
ncbi:MAG: hypothetical protein ACK2T6_00945 [Anaerolineae bacterium]